MSDIEKRMRQCYADMKQGCYNPKSQQYKNYGARGITVCARWLECYSNFFDDMGTKPDGYSLDRIDNNKGYSKDNCRWANIKEQRNNQRRSQILELNGISMCRGDWAKHTGMSDMTLKVRMARGMTLQEAIEVPIDQDWRKKARNALAKRWGNSAIEAHNKAGKEQG